MWLEGSWLFCPQIRNPAIQNDFSYYRRTISRNRINNMNVSSRALASVCWASRVLLEAFKEKHNCLAKAAWSEGIISLQLGGIMLDGVTRPLMPPLVRRLQLVR